MANILITNVCNRNCPYCFARGKVSLPEEGGDPGAQAPDAAPDSGFTPKFITLEALNRILDFYQPRPREEIVFLGGEPTMHPQFTEAAEAVFSRGRPLKIFSNGIMRQETRDYIGERGADGRIMMIVNANEPGSRGSSEDTELRKTLEQLGHIVTVGFTLFQPDAEMEFLLQLIEQYDLNPVIRFGVGMPIWGQDNAHLELADHRRAAERITAFAERCDKDRVFLKLDCGMILCMFTREQIGRLYYAGGTFQSTCNPIPDIDADLNVWHCFPLSQVGRFHLDQFSSPQELNAHLKREMKGRAPGGIFDECRFCRHFHRGYCKGGCLSHVLRAKEQGGKLPSIKDFGLEI